jgi:hypothetical protein
MLIQVISSTTREGHFSEKVASWVTGHLEAAGGAPEGTTVRDQA